MPNEVDKSLLDRLQALRGSSAEPERAPAKVEFDVIERKKTPTREDALAARLKSLRSQDEAKSPPPKPAPQATSPAAQSTIPEKHASGIDREDDDVDAAFQTDDQTLEELLGDVGEEEAFTATEPDDARVKALLEELSQSIPQDDESKANGNGDRRRDSDDSDGDDMQREVDNVIARFRDEIEVEAAISKDDDEEPLEKDQEKDDQDEQDDQPADLALPSVPTDLTTPSKPSPSSIDDITTRLSALQSPSDSLSLPSVPTSRPAKEPKRLQSRTGYTDDDVDSWCTVCLADATLRCLGCSDEGDPYCTRCWREMHVGPAAAFDDRGHKAVQFGRARKRDKEAKVALGA